MPEVNAVVEDKAVPPVAVLYHFNAVPVAVKSATVALLQKDWALAVGAATVFIITSTIVLVLSQLDNVWET